MCRFNIKGFHLQEYFKSASFIFIQQRNKHAINLCDKLHGVLGKYMYVNKLKHLLHTSM